MPQVIDYTVTPVVEHFVKNPPSPKFHGIFGSPSLLNLTMVRLLTLAFRRCNRVR